ncbi:MAG: hypothetical protein OEZ34_12520 [Spirochaetia bacterium]|nr:hypothetical protein [Spirochaetia bacterium]
MIQKSIFIKILVIFLSLGSGLLVIVCNQGNKKGTSSGAQTSECKELEEKLMESSIYMSTSKSFNPSPKESKLHQEYKEKCRKNEQQP